LRRASILIALAFLRPRLRQKVGGWEIAQKLYAAPGEIIERARAASRHGAPFL
jgi:hypothetical protein